MEKYIDFKNQIDIERLEIIASTIKEGGIIVFPTETVYAIGTNGMDENAIKKLYNIKQRPLDKPISLLVSDFDMIKNITKDITNIEMKIMNTFFPGPLTIILKKRNNIPDILSGNSETIGIRMPDNEIAKKIIEYSGVPIAAPSANISGKPSGIEMNTIINDLKNKVDYYIDGGKCKIGQASTIVKVVDDVPIILREGSISKKQILDII